MRVLALAVVVAALDAGCIGDPDGVANQPGYIYAAFGTGAQAFDDPSSLAYPNDLVIDPDTGIAYVLDFNHYQIRAFSPDGSINTIAGTGNLGSPVNGPALDADFSHMGDLLLDGAGGLYVAAWHNSFVVRIDLMTAELTRIAGMGTRTKYSGDGGPAIAADLSMAASLAFLPDGRLVVTDQENQVVRAIDVATGLIDDFAGRCVVEPDAPCTATPVACPDSQKLACDLSKCSYPCTAAFVDAPTRDAARFGFPYGAQALPSGKLALAPDGTVYVTDPFNERVRAIRPDGRVETLPDIFPSPYDIAVAADGTMYVVDTYASCIYRRDVDGAISVVAGVCGQDGYAGDNGLATKALLDRPLGIALDEVAHRLYIADSNNHRIRFLTLPH